MYLQDHSSLGGRLLIALLGNELGQGLLLLASQKPKKRVLVAESFVLQLKAERLLFGRRLLHMDDGLVGER